jgi:hypothetical protein
MRVLLTSRFVRKPGRHSGCVLARIETDTPCGRSASAGASHKVPAERGCPRNCDPDQGETHDQSRGLYGRGLAIPNDRYAFRWQLQLSRASARLDGIRGKRSAASFECDLRARARRHASRLFQRPEVEWNALSGAAPSNGGCEQ